MAAPEKPDQLVAPFMVAEFETLTSRILALEQTRAKRVDFYIVIVSAAIGSLSLAASLQSPSTFSQAIIPALSLAVFLLGAAILNENVGLAAQAVFMYRRAGRIRCWFRDKHPAILPYLPWTAADDTPPFDAETEHSTFAGKDSILWLGNSLSGAGFTLAILLLYVPLLPIISCAIAAAVLVGIWIGQNLFLKYRMKRYERIGVAKGRIHFPRKARIDKSP